jgi:cobalt-zinc-cadmium efflux system membrane fusion protein
MMKKLLPIFLFLSACGPATSDGEPVAGGEDAAAHVEGEVESVHVEPENMVEWGLEVGSPRLTSLRVELELPGVLTTNDNRTARIASLVEGQLAERMVDLGSRVSTGQTLAALNAPEFTRAQTVFLQAYAQAELSRTDYERAMVLRDQRAMEEREFLRRQSLVVQHIAELRSAEVILHSFGVGEDRLRAMTAGLTFGIPGEDHTSVESLLPIRTPIGGVVIERDAVLGDHIEPGRNLFTVSDLSVLWARLDAYEQQIGQLDPDADVVIRTPLLPDRSFTGKITFISDQVDPELRTVRVRVEVPNPQGELRPNMYVQGFLRVMGGGADRLILPVDAVQLHEGHHVVFVQAPPEPGEDHLVFETREVETGETFTDGIIILGGLDGTEQVVTVGAFTLKAEMTKGAGGDGHVH